MKKRFSLSSLLILLLSSTSYAATDASTDVSVMPEADPICNNTLVCELGSKAEQAFFQGWANGDWSDFQAMLNKDDLIFQFPAGPLKGRTEGKQGYQNMVNWIAHHIESKNRIHKSVRNQRFGLDDWYYFADEAGGTFYGNAYTGSHFIGFRFNNGKIVEYREYVGDLTHWK